MPIADDKVRVFEDSVLLPALQELSESPALGRDFDIEVVVTRPAKNAVSEELLANLEGALRRRAGPSLVLTERPRKDPAAPAVAGIYVMTPFYELSGDEASASPGVMFWMRFNNKLHAFAHRYDNAIARHPVSQITRPHVLNHVLNSLTFFKLYAWSQTPFPGYR